MAAADEGVDVGGVVEGVEVGDWVAGLGVNLRHHLKVDHQQNAPVVAPQRYLGGSVKIKTFFAFSVFAYCLSFLNYFLLFLFVFIKKQTVTYLFSSSVLSRWRKFPLHI